MTFRQKSSFSLANESVDVVKWFAFHQAQWFPRHYGDRTPQLDTFSSNGVVSIASNSQMRDNGSWLKQERRTGDGAELPVPCKHVREKMLIELFSSSLRSPHNKLWMNSIPRLVQKHLYWSTLILLNWQQSTSNSNSIRIDSRSRPVEGNHGLWIPRHGFRIQVLDSDSLSVEIGFRIPWAGLRIPNLRIPNSTNFPDYLTWDARES